MFSSNIPVNYDAAVWEGSPNSEFKNQTEYYVGYPSNARERYLMRFSTSSVPSGEQIVCGFVYVFGCTGAGANSNVALYKLNPDANWGTVTWAKHLAVFNPVKINAPAVTNHSSNLLLKGYWNRITVPRDYIYTSSQKAYNSYGLWEHSIATYIRVKAKASGNAYMPYMILQYTQAPSGLSCTQVGYNQVGISWDRMDQTPGVPEENLIAFDIYRSLNQDSGFEKIGRVSSSYNNYIDHGAKWDAVSSSGTHYYYRVKGVWKYGETEYHSSFSSVTDLIVVKTYPVVQRFLLRDLEGEFPDYVFEINPTSYNPEDELTFGQGVIALSGRRGWVSFPRHPETRKMSWDVIPRTMYIQLRDRWLSGNVFYLLDHNNEEIVGIITEFNAEEIVATVPSKYRLNMTITGIGKPE